MPGPRKPQKLYPILTCVTHRAFEQQGVEAGAARQSSAMSGVPQIGLPLTLSEVLISTGTPVSAAERGQHVGEERVLRAVDGLEPGGAVGVHDRGDRVAGPGR